MQSSLNKSYKAVIFNGQDKIFKDIKANLIKNAASRETDNDLQQFTTFLG